MRQEHLSITAACQDRLSCSGGRRASISDLSERAWGRLCPVGHSQSSFYSHVRASPIHSPSNEGEGFRVNTMKVHENGETWQRVWA